MVVEGRDREEKWGDEGQGKDKEQQGVLNMTTVDNFCTDREDNLFVEQQVHGN